MFIDGQFYSISDLATLELEVTPEIEVVLRDMLIEKCMAEVKENNIRRAEEDSFDEEAVLSTIIDWQERMCRGMKLIQECNKVIWHAQNKQRIPYTAYIAWVERRKALWNHWNMLRDACKALIGEKTWLWTKYFSLAAEIINPYFSSGDTSEVDNLVRYSDDTSIILRDSHLEEMNASHNYSTRDLFGFWRSDYSRRLENQQLEFASLCESLCLTAA